jgi:hypothetical protein
MTDTEELIASALARQADRAPHPGPIVHALAKRRHRSWRTLVVIVVAMLVTGGISVPLALQSSPDQPAPTPAPDPVPRDTSSGVPMAYMPTYLPQGYVETRRTTSESGDSQVRTWTKGNSDVYLMAIGPTHRDQPKCLQASTGARSVEQGAPTHITWDAHGWCLQLTADASVSAAERQKIVESVKPDEMAMVRSPVRFDSLPSFLTDWFMDVSSGPLVDIRVLTNASGRDNRAIEITIAPRQVLDQRKVPASVGHLVTERDLGDGRVMRVHFSGAPDDFTSQEREQILGAIQVVPVDYSWLGK